MNTKICGERQKAPELCSAKSHKNSKRPKLDMSKNCTGPFTHRQWWKKHTHINSTTLVAKKPIIH